MVFLEMLPHPRDFLKVFIFRFGGILIISYVDVFNQPALTDDPSLPFLRIAHFVGDVWMVPFLKAESSMTFHHIKTDRNEGKRRFHKKDKTTH